MKINSNMKIKITILLLLFRLNSFCQDLPHENNDAKMLLLCNKGQTKEQLFLPNATMQLSPTANIFNNSNRRALIFPLRDENVSSFIKKSEIIIGGHDSSENLRVAASGNQMELSDFVPGPIPYDEDIDPNACNNWDIIFTVTKEEILQHMENFKNGLYNDVNNHSLIPASIKYWPAIGNPFWHEKYSFDLAYNNNYYRLASYYDTNQDAFYDPSAGDFPTLNSYCDFPSSICKSLSFWVMNDTGSNHSLTKGEPINIQLNCYAYSFDTYQDSIENISFRIEFINFSDSDIEDFHVGFRYDFDLGCPYDDNIGIDTFQNLMYIYNDSVDDGAEQAGCNFSNNGYSPYLLGLQYTGGLRTPKVFVYDDDGNKIYDDFGNVLLSDPILNSGEIDTLVNSRISSFIVKEACKEQLNCDYNNDHAYYNLLKGKKIDGESYTQEGKIIKHMFPNNPASSSWSMCNDNSLDDKDIEAMMSVGPIHLQPGAINSFNFSFHLINNSDYCPDIIPFVVEANRPIESFYERCYDTHQSYPLSPSVAFMKKSDSEIEISLPDNANNQKMKSFLEIFYSDPEGYNTSVTDNYGAFEGIMIFQLRDSSSYINSNMDDENNMRLIHQSDMENGVIDAYNYFSIIDSKPYNLNHRTWIKKLMVKGNNKGLASSFVFDDDLFEEGIGLVKEKTYWFAAYSYAFNNWKELDTFNGYGQSTQFWSGLPSVYKFVNNNIVNTNQENIFLPKVTCYNNSINIQNFENNLNLKIYDITGKLIISQNIFENNFRLLNSTNNKLLMVDLEDTITHKRSVSKVFCTE